MPEVGLKVRIEVESHNGSTNFEGIVLHPASKGHLTLKLVNGYNASYLLEENNFEGSPNANDARTDRHNRQALKAS